MNLRPLITIALLACAGVAFSAEVQSLWFKPRAAASAPGGYLYASNLVVALDFASADTLLTDSSGNGRDAVCSNGVLVADADGASFTNKPYLQLPQSACVSNNGTIALRVYPRYMSSYDGWCGLGVGTTAKIVLQTYTPSYWNGRGEGWNMVSASGASPSNVWYDIVMTWSTNAGVGAAFYVSSNNLSTVALIATDTAITDNGFINNFRVGELPAGNYPADGILRKFRVYNRWVNGTEVTNIVTEMRP